MTDQKTDPGIGGGAPTVPDAPPSTEPTLPEERVGMARYTTDPRVVISPEREVLRGLRAEPTPLNGLRDLVQDVHDLQEAKKLREAAIEQAKVEHQAEAPTVPRSRSRRADTPRMEPKIIDETPAVERSPSRLEVTSPGERARTRVGTRQLLGVAALCALIGVVFVYVITRGGAGSTSDTTATSSSATASASTTSPTTSAPSATTLSSSASATPSVSTTETTPTSVVAPAPSASETTAPSAKHAAPTKTGTASTASSVTPNSASAAAPPLTAATAPPTPPTPVSVAPGPTGSAPNIWKIKEH